MQLVDALASGVRGAENGTARLFRRGTATRATWFANFEASTQDSSGEDVGLDSNGSKVLYVNEVTEVECYSSLGVLVRSFTVGNQAYSSEVISAAFTGVDYTTGVSAVSKPVTEGALYDRWLESAGSIDWKVLLNGTATTLQNAVGALTRFVFNVRSPQFGAAGDGVTDDTAAITAARTAASSVGGGIVYFPPGTYRISSAIAWNEDVHLVGAGASQCIITTDSASNARMFTFATTGNLVPQVIWGISFQSTQANTGEQLFASAAVNWLIGDCHFGSSTTSTGTLISLSGASRLRLVHSRVTANTSGTGLLCTTTSDVAARDCIFDAGTTTYNGSFVKVDGYADIEGCHFDNTTITGAGTFYGVELLSSTARMRMRACRFTQATQTFTNGIRLVAGARAIVRDLSVPASSSLAFYNAVTLANGSYLQSVPASNGDQPLIRNDSIGTAVTLPFCDLFQGRSTTTVPTVTMPNGYYPGQRIKVILWNDSGGTWGANVTWTGATVNIGQTTNAANGNYVFGEFVFTDIAAGGTYAWVAESLKLGSSN